MALSVLSLSHAPPLWVRGAGAGAGGAVAAVAVDAARGLLRPSFQRVREDRFRKAAWMAYLVACVAAVALIGPYLVLVRRQRPSIALGSHWGPLAAVVPAMSAGGLGALVWTALKVGALSFGGGFVIIPLMQGDAVHTYHWMTNGQFLNAVALGQVTPGPVVATVAAVGYGAHGLAGGVLAAVAFTPSFSFILLGGARFEQIREIQRARASSTEQDPPRSAQSSARRSRSRRH